MYISKGTQTIQDRYTSLSKFDSHLHLEDLMQRTRKKNDRYQLKGSQHKHIKYDKNIFKSSSDTQG